MLNTSDRYLVTGGSGFLGRALIRRLDEIGIRKIVVLARNEGKLMELRSEFPHVEIIPGDVADPVVCRRAVHGVDGIFHLAAFKHVTLAEKDPYQCVQTNIIGTNNLLVETLHMKPKFMLFVSTDKAAQVRGVYSASKLVGEQVMNQFAKMNPGTVYMAVRYGNVWRSTGSFIELWEKAAREGRRPIITDPGATRFFFKVDAAVDLVMSAIAIGSSGLTVPKMKAVKMGVVMQAFKDAYGPVKFDQIGLQAGENLHETIDGSEYSDTAPQYTVEEFTQEFLRC